MIFIFFKLEHHHSYLHAMRKLVLYLLTAIIAVGALIWMRSCDEQDENESGGSLIQMVNPFIGTGGHGHTYPGATAPFGMVQLSPDTRLTGWDGCGGYHYTDSVIYGFSHTHLQGTGISDYGDILLMPTGDQPYWNNGAKTGSTNGYSSTFQKSSEEASAGYYKVYLNEPKVKVELTASTRCGLHRYTFDEEGTKHFTLDLLHRDSTMDWSLEQINDTLLIGHRVSKEWAAEQHVYFAMGFDHPIQSVHQKGKSSPGDIERQGTGVFSISFDISNGNELIVATGISAVDTDGAIAALKEEHRGKTFHEHRTALESMWQAELSDIVIKGGTEEQRKIFYTSLYHSYTVPNMFSDVDGRYRGLDGEIHEGEDGDRYTVFSLWDTYRATHPLYTITQRERTLDFVNNFLGHYQEGGKLPMWELAGNYTGCMIGYHAVPVIVDAWFSGIKDFDANLALEAMVSTATTDELGKKAFADLGYIPMDVEHESVSKALEYAYNDWCIARFAEDLGETDIARKFYSRADNYRNHFDPKTGFMRARFNGGFSEPFDPAEVNFNFTEANSWQYSFYVPQDIHGLIELYGDADNFREKLNELFSTSANVSGREQPDITGLIGQYAHGNEPSHHMAYLYHHLGQPASSVNYVHQILNELYQDAPDGLSGNEDCGQMSSWYVLSAIGLYPVCPGSGEFLLNTPIFKEIDISLESGKHFKIVCDKDPAQSPYIQKAKLNGQPMTRLYLKHEEILAGATLELELSDDPLAMMTASTLEDLPGLTNLLHQPTVPIISSPELSFTDSLEVSIYAADGQSEIYYSLNGTDFSLYEQPFTIYEESSVDAYSESEDGERSAYSEARFFTREQGRSIKIDSEFSTQYTAGGQEALIDGLRGGEDFRTGFWQGYFGEDIIATVDLGEVKQINYLAAGFLEEIKPWIWFPKKVIFEVSVDGQEFKAVATIENDGPIDDYETKIRDFSAKVKTSARFVRLKANNFGTIPEWHLGKGNPSWIFIDEIIIR